MNIVLAGNPNSGKTTLFNILTRLNQTIANFAGTTVEKKTGGFYINDTESGTASFISVTDLPGAYSMYPKSAEEEITSKVLKNEDLTIKPDLVVFVADASNLKRSLFFFSQLSDTDIPVLLALNMIDIADKNGLTINTELLSQKLGVSIVEMNARKKKGTDKLHDEIFNFFNAKNKTKDNPAIKTKMWLNGKSGKQQASETLERYRIVSGWINECVMTNENSDKNHVTEKLDGILTHKIFGYLIFLTLLFLIFQAIFNFASYPMNMIESGFINLSTILRNVLPEGVFTNMLTNGILPGIGGIVMFVPQIALLFAFIGILEDTGYMARVSFIMDKLMRKLGLSGRSVIPLISGTACAVPAIMSARTISNWKERIITIMVTPLMTCSARLPVYILLISLVIPSGNFAGIFNFQGIVLMGLYVLGFIATIAVAFIMKLIIKTNEKSYFIMELPIYRMPRWSSIGITIFDKVKVFLIDVGKVIIAIAVILWALSSYGPGDKFNDIDNTAEKLEASYAGVLGKAIEPVIKPLGFDWKIGIALITSFAAREVFVGTMATIFHAGDGGAETATIREKMKTEINPETGKPRYGFAFGISLMVFYAFAMQCMSTIAVVYRETGHWKWPVIQIAYMSGLAYLSSLLVYTLLR